ncbi:MAG: hypothetical protein AB1634_19030, partial [Thermodesulfobacteriota bacterium]
QALQGWLPAWLPLPLPAPFLLGLDAQLAETGYPAYLLGRFNASGFPHYYLVAWLVKTPEPFLVATLLALLGGRLQPRELPALAMGLGSLLVFSLAGHKNIGIRYLLFLIPVAALACGRLAAAGRGLLARPAWLRPAVLVLLAGWQLAVAVTAWPDFLAYFNQASGGTAAGHRYLLDSNLDWGQDLIALADYQDRHRIPVIELAAFTRLPPEIYGIRYRTLTGEPAGRHVAVSANLLWGRMYFVNGTDFWPGDPDLYARFRDLSPQAILGGSLYLFDLGPVPEP